MKNLLIISFHTYRNTWLTYRIFNKKIWKTNTMQEQSANPITNFKLK